MKSRLLAVPLALTLAVAACSDLLTENPKSFITTDNYFKTPAEVEGAVIAAYNPYLTDWGPGTGFRLYQWWTFEAAADEGRFHPDEPNAETQAPEFLDWGPGARDSRTAWILHYQIISRANTALDAAEKVTFPDAARKAVLVGEARFLRAYSYFWLARAFGGVPLYAGFEEQAKGQKPRASEAEVIDMVIQDAQAAAAALPATRGAGQKGRATSVAANLLLADAYRWKANVLNGGQDAWTKAAAAAKQVIDNPSYGLVPDYLQAFLPGSQDRKEEIFSAVTFRNGPIEATTAYGGVFFPRNMGVAGIDGWAVVSPTPEFYASYTPGDYRWEVTFWRNQCSGGADSSSYDVDGQTRPCPAGDTLVHFSPQGLAAFPNGYPHVHKYRPSDKGRDFYHGDVNVILYRYAEALLIYAEAQLKLNNTAEALRYVNMVRARARNGNGTGTRTQPADLSGLTLDQLYQERAWELSYELGKRWFDLVQRGEAYFTSQFQANDKLALSKGNVNAVHMRLPIPAEELQKNPALTQNPGY